MRTTAIRPGRTIRAVGPRDVTLIYLPSSRIRRPPPGGSPEGGLDPSQAGRARGPSLRPARGGAEPAGGSGAAAGAVAGRKPGPGEGTNAQRGDAAEDGLRG